MMSLTPVADHRAVDGVIAGDFLRRVKEALELAPSVNGRSWDPARGYSFLG